MPEAIRRLLNRLRGRERALALAWAAGRAIAVCIAALILCCGLVIVFAYRWAEHHRVSDAWLIGLSIGAAALTRGEGVFLIVLLCAPLVWMARTLTRRRQLASYFWMVLGCTVLLGPWMVRNLTTFETFVPLSTNGSELHVYSNCADTYNGKFLGFWLFDCQQRVRDPNRDGIVDFEPTGDEAQKAKYWQSVGFEYARDHVSELPKVVLARIGRQWDLFRPLQTASFAPIEGRDQYRSRAQTARNTKTVTGMSLAARRECASMLGHNARRAAAAAAAGSPPRRRLQSTSAAAISIERSRTQ